MNEEHLIEVFNEGFENFKNFKWDDEKLILKKAPAKHEVYASFMREFYQIYINEIIANLEDMVIQVDHSINSELSFHFDKKSIEEIISRRVSSSAKEYLNNPYHSYANPENIHEAFFEPKKYKELSWSLWQKHQEEILEWHKSKETNFDTEKILEEDFVKINQLITILIENNLLNDKLEKLKSENIPKSTSQKRLSINQTILLLDELKFIQKIEHNTLTVQARLISKICGYHEKNIKNSLERLGEKQSVWSNQYKKDVKIVNNTISELELILDKENGTN